MAILLLLAAWGGAMALVSTLSPEWQVRATARMALLFALPGGLLFPWLPWGERFARWCWSLAWLAYVVHVAVAFHLVHHWSHAAAIAHVQRRSGFGPGLWFSHLFTGLLTLDVVWWWACPRSWRARPRWAAWGTWGYLGFMAFNATVVYETGFIRMGGAAFFVAIAASMAAQMVKSRQDGGNR